MIRLQKRRKNSTNREQIQWRNTFHDSGQGGSGDSGAVRFDPVAGKPLVLLAGKPMIQRVYERAKLAQRADRVIVATDDERIVKAVEGFGGEARMTRSEHRTGTERVAEVAAREEGDVFLNVQGDEPLLDPQAIDMAVNSLLEEPQASISTVATPIKTPGDIMDPNW